MTSMVDPIDAALQSLGLRLHRVIVEGSNGAKGQCCTEIGN